MPAAAEVDRELWADRCGDARGDSSVARVPAAPLAHRDDICQDERAPLAPRFPTPTSSESRTDRLLARAADESGLRHYVAALAAGETRANVVRALILSDEFAQRSSRVPRDTQLCELANPAKWDNEEWVAILRSLGLSDDKRLMHRKPYEFAQLIYGCRRLGVLGDDSTCSASAPGTKACSYWLANHVGRVIATDMYEGVWQQRPGPRRRSRMC